jgi:hypothetical protein
MISRRRTALVLAVVVGLLFWAMIAALAFLLI